VYRDLDSIYIKIFLRGRAFSSPEFDSLASRMDADRYLDRNREERYFMTKDRVLALSLGNKVLFGKAFHDSLSREQRLAVLAHEFSHIRDGDNRYKAKKVIQRSFLALTAMLILPYALTGSLILSALASSLAFLIALELSALLNRMKYNEMEVRCDKVAVSYLGGRALEESLVIAQSYIHRKGRWDRKLDESPKSSKAIRSILLLQRRIELIQGYGKALVPAPDAPA
jgi:Zn-dependent protease with chaperone function